MNRRRTLLLALPSLPLAAVGGKLLAQETVKARQNIEYRLIEPPQPVETGDKIEVVDFFWYGCPYCNQLSPFLEAWTKAKPTDVAVRRIPAILKDTWAPHARIYYTLELLNEAERLHTRVFYGYHVEELHMSKPDVMEQWAVRNGIEPHAGHGLTYDNVQPIAAIPQLAELNIGHYLVGEAVFVGLEESVRRMRELMDAAR